jgi:hypothetical protein
MQSNLNIIYYCCQIGASFEKRTDFLSIITSWRLDWCATKEIKHNENNTALALDTQVSKFKKEWPQITSITSTSCSKHLGYDITNHSELSTRTVVCLSIHRKSLLSTPCPTCLLSNHFQTFFKPMLQSNQKKTSNCLKDPRTLVLAIVQYTIIACCWLDVQISCTQRNNLKLPSPFGGGSDGNVQK